MHRLRRERNALEITHVPNEACGFGVRWSHAEPLGGWHRPAAPAPTAYMLVAVPAALAFMAVVSAKAGRALGRVALLD